MLRVAGSLITNQVRAYDLLRVFGRDGHPTPLGRAFAEYGRIEKTFHLFDLVDPVDDAYRRRMNRRLTVQESRHILARAICYGRRGHIQQAYKDGQEDQLASMGLVLNAVVLCMQHALPGRRHRQAPGAAHRPARARRPGRGRGMPVPAEGRPCERARPVRPHLLPARKRTAPAARPGRGGRRTGRRVSRRGARPGASVRRRAAPDLQAGAALRRAVVLWPGVRRAVFFTRQGLCGVDRRWHGRSSP